MKIRVLQFTIAKTKGGRTQYILNLWKNIDKSRFQFDFVTFSSELEFEDELLAEGCKIHYLSCHPEKDEKRFREEFSNVLENDYDVIHIHTSFWRGMLVEEMAKECGVKKIIIHSHSSGITCDSSDTEEGRKKHFQVRAQLSEDIATDFWACSKVAAEWLYGDNIPKEKIKILLNSVETERFSFNSNKRKTIRTEMEILENEFVIGHVGRLAKVKNHGFLIDVFKEITKKNNKVRLWIVGEGEEREAIEKQIQEYKLENSITLFGKREDIDLLLQGMDCFVLPSYFEGFPIVLVESQTSGLPCLVSDTITKEVAVTNNIDYLPLVKEKWTNHILRIMEERPLRISGHEAVRQAGLDVDTQVKLLEELYC